MRNEPPPARIRKTALKRRTSRRALSVIPLLAGEKVQERFVELFGVRPVETVRRVFQDDELAVLDRRLRPLPRHLERDDPIGVSVDDERGDVELREILPEVGQPGRDAGDRAGRRGAGGDVPGSANEL